MSRKMNEGSPGEGEGEECQSGSVGIGAWSGQDNGVRPEVYGKDGCVVF